MIGYPRRTVTVQHPHGFRLPHGKATKSPIKDSAVGFFVAVELINCAGCKGEKGLGFLPHTTCVRPARYGTFGASLSGFSRFLLNDRQVSNVFGIIHVGDIGLGDVILQIGDFHSSRQFGGC